MVWSVALCLWFSILSRLEKLWEILVFGRNPTRDPSLREMRLYILHKSRDSCSTCSWAEFTNNHREKLSRSHQTWKTLFIKERERKKKKNLGKSNFVVGQSLSWVWLFATLWTDQASLPFTISQSSLRLMYIESIMPSNHLILCLPLLLLPSIFPRIRIFSNGLALHNRWPKY